MATHAASVTAPRSPALIAEAARYPWWGNAWAGTDAGSRAAYDHWVGAARGGRAGRRARTVTRRVWNRRPWAGVVKRRLQAAWDLVDNDRTPLTTDVAVGPPGWLP